jgi:hypothetical protein
MSKKGEQDLRSQAGVGEMLDEVFDDTDQERSNRGEDLDVLLGADGVSDDIDEVQDYPEDNEAEYHATDTMPPETKEARELLESVKAAEEGEDDTSEVEVEAEVEAEAEAEAEVEVEVEAEAEAEADKDEPLIPKHRFDEVNRKRKEAEDRLKQYEEAEISAAAPEPVQAPEDFFPYAEKEAEYSTMVLEGRTEEAVALRAEVRQAELAHQNAVIDYRSTERIADNSTNAAIVQAARDVETAFPEFDETSDSYNLEMSQEGVDLALAYSKMPKYANNQPKAIHDAAQRTLMIYGLLDRDGNRVGEMEAAEDATVTKTNQAATKAVAKNTKVANAQPTKVTRKDRESEREPALDLNNMSDEEFAALPESTIARLQGDYVE